MTPLDSDKSVAVTIDVVPFVSDKLALGFTRGFVQSQAFVRHFGLKAVIQPKNHKLIFDTSQVSGKNAKGQEYTFEDQYQWLGFTARQRITELLDEVLADTTLTLDVFAYTSTSPTSSRAC